jgi:hypothetical protein
MIEAGLKPEYEIVLVRSQEEAVNYKFSGSPMVTVDGIDVDPMARETRTYSLNSCRVYVHNGKTYDHPPKAMMLETLNK